VLGNLTATERNQDQAENKQEIADSGFVLVGLLFQMVEKNQTFVLTDYDCVAAIREHRIHSEPIELDQETQELCERVPAPVECRCIANPFGMRIEALPPIQYPTQAP
jgi:hypothetical protein